MAARTAVCPLYLLAAAPGAASQRRAVQPLQPTCSSSAPGFLQGRKVDGSFLGGTQTGDACLLGAINIFDPANTYAPPALGSGNAITNSSTGIDITDAWVELGAVDDFTGCYVFADVCTNGTINLVVTGNCQLSCGQITLNSTAFAGCRLAAGANSFPVATNASLSPSGSLTFSFAQFPVTANASASWSLAGCPGQCDRAAPCCNADTGLPQPAGTPCTW